VGVRRGERDVALGVQVAKLLTQRADNVDLGHLRDEGQVRVHVHNALIRDRVHKDESWHTRPTQHVAPAPLPQTYVHVHTPRENRRVWMPSVVCDGFA
jgi:hypothetical protein